MTLGEATAIVAFSVVVIDYGVEIVKRVAAGKQQGAEKGFK